MTLIDRVRATLSSPPPLPGGGATARRHRLLYDLGREDLSLARLAEAHWDAIAILCEADREPVPGAVYGVWAAEIPGQSLTLTDGALSGIKPFCSGAGLIDRALITVTAPVPRLVEIDVRSSPGLAFDHSKWHTQAFAQTGTATATFSALPVATTDFVGPEDFYLSRPGFWNGACGPACCWAGGAAHLVDWALKQKRSDPHTLAHLGAMDSAQWAMAALLQAAGDEMDANPRDTTAGQIRALRLRHLVESHSTSILRALARAYGPHPLAFNEEISQNYAELDLYLRQSHAERDLEALGRMVHSPA